MNQKGFEEFLLSETHADCLERVELVQSLWSGYGSLVRAKLTGSEFESVIVKYVNPENRSHPRGWNTVRSHRRKLKSYQVESHWYSSKSSTTACLQARIAKCYGAKTDGPEVILLLEDLDAAGFAGRRSSVNETEWKACVRWLASFHAQNLNLKPEGLWASGTYWHLETRPDELECLEDQALKDSAVSIDRALKDCLFQTLVHGDAKLANFCFTPDGAEVAAVDFQYVGGGCGMKDLAYFVGSCFRDHESEKMENTVLEHYFEQLGIFLNLGGSGLGRDELEEDWRPLYRVAWADFHRFMKGWSPGHWKLSDYSERVTREIMDALREK